MSQTRSIWCLGHSPAFKKSGKSGYGTRYALLVCVMLVADEEIVAEPNLSTRRDPFILRLSSPSKIRLCVALPLRSFGAFCILVYFLSLQIPRRVLLPVWMVFGVF